MRRSRPRSLTTTPSVTVVIPCYRYGHYLPDLVARLMEETDVDLDVVIVDDASPDGSGDVATDLARQHGVVQALVHTKNAGHIATYNDGLALATGDYVVLLSADDLLPRGAVGRAVALMEAHPHVGLVYGFARSFSGDLPPDDGAAVRSWTVWPGRSWLRRRLKTGRNVISSPEVVMRRSALLDVGGYDPRLPHSADLDLWLRTAARWDIGRVDGTVQAWYRVHGQNMHLTTYASWVTDLDERGRTFGLFYDDHARDDEDLQALRDNTARALAREALRRGIAAGTTGEGLDEVPALAAFARRTWPAVTLTRQWHRFQRGALAGRAPVPIQVHALVLQVQTHVRWRAWRRYGT